MRHHLRRSPRTRAVLLLLVACLLGACQMQVELSVVVDDDGSGVVEAAVGLDADAVARRPDLVDELELNDLVATGWDITGPAEEDDGTTWIRARHRFAEPDEANRLLAEVSGPEGPFRDFRLRREDRFAATEFRFTGVVDFSGGLGSVSDPALDRELGARGVGDVEDLVGPQLGEVMDEAVRVQVAVRLPGEVRSNATTQARNGVVWRLPVTAAAPSELEATSTVSRSARLAWLVVAVLAGVALVLFLVVRVAVAVRRRRAA